MKKSVPLRLYAGLALAIVLVLLVVALTINSLQKQEEGRQWVDHTIKVVEQVHDIRYTLSQMRAAKRTYWITGKNAFLDMFTSGAVTVPNRINAVKTMISDNPVQIANVNRLDSSISGLFSFWGTQNNSDPSTSKEKFAAFTYEEEKLMRAIYTQFEQVNGEEGRMLALREANLTRYTTQTKQILIIGILILMMVVLVLVNAVIVTLKSRIRASNKLHASLEEMGRVNAVAEEKNWVLEGVSRINADIQSADGTNDLSGDIIKSVVNYLKLPAGAIYLADEKGKKLTMASAVAVSASARDSFDVGIGIVGNAALSREISIIHNIPADYWKI
ncbi:MAG: sensor histidine kinase, partial [Sediminibacterium sp.]|nr:sensor histidine kinase [Sediminibacterium sp.]